MERTRDDEGRCATVCVCAIESYRVNVCDCWVKHVYVASNTCAVCTTDFRRFDDVRASVGGRDAWWWRYVDALYAFLQHTQIERAYVFMIAVRGCLADEIMDGSWIFHSNTCFDTKREWELDRLKKRTVQCIRSHATYDNISTSSADAIMNGHILVCDKDLSLTSEIVFCDQYNAVKIVCISEN